MDPEFGLAYLGIGYGLAFMALIIYVVHLSRRQRMLEKRLEELREGGPQGES